MSPAWMTNPLAGLLLAVLALPLAAQEQADSAARTGPSIVSGRVVEDEGRRPIEGARVSLTPAGPAGAAPELRESGADGRFEFDDVPPGDYRLVVTALGYRRFQDSLHVEPGSLVRMLVRVSTEPIELEPITVVTARRPAFMDAFEERRADASRHSAFFTREEIEEQDPRDLAELFQPTPGVTVLSRPFGDRLRVDGDPGRPRGCRPDVWVNGYLQQIDTTFSVEELYPPEDIQAIELYALEHDVPQAFKGPRHCGALVIWLRVLGPEEQPPATWKRWLAVLGILGATVLLTR